MVFTGLWLKIKFRHNSWEPEDNILDERLIQLFQAGTPSGCKKNPVIDDVVGHTNDMRTRSHGPAEISTTDPGRLTENWRKKHLRADVKVAENRIVKRKRTANSTKVSSEADNTLSVKRVNTEAVMENRNERSSPPPPKLLPMVSDVDLIRIKEQKSRENQPSKAERSSQRTKDLIITEVEAHNIRVTFRENFSPEGFFHCF